LENGLRGCGVGVLGIDYRRLYKIKIHKLYEKVRDVTDIFDVTGIVHAITVLLRLDDFK
jgi:hypothetical protein